MMLNESRGRAFGGGSLAGDNLVRHVYLDESGTGSIESDPYLVVAGVIVDADKHLLSMTNTLRRILHESVPQGANQPSYLHAKDIYHNTKEFRGDVWSDKRRKEILKALSLVPISHGCAVVYGSVWRQGISNKVPGLSDKARDQAAYGMAAAMCLMQVEKFMQMHAAPNEIAQVTFEAGAKGTHTVKEVSRYMKSPAAFILEEIHGSGLLPITRIIDTPNFQEKDDASALQAADYCAFALKRRESASKNWEWMCEPVLRACLSVRPAGLKPNYGEDGG